MTEKRKCPICGDYFGPRYKRFEKDVWEYNYYCSPRCFEEAEEKLHDALLFLKGSSISLPPEVSWVSEDNRTLRSEQNSIDWKRLCILKDSSIKHFPTISAAMEEDDELEEIEEEQPQGFLGIAKNVPTKPGPGQKSCRFCKNVIGVRSLTCKYCGKNQ